MQKAEAQKLIGSPVQAWTSANGIYAGTLVEVVTEKGRPWRGRIKVESVLAPAQHFEQGNVCRRGFREGETVEVGGANITPIKEVQETRKYLDVLVDSLYSTESKGPPPIGDIWVHNGFVDGLAATICAELNRIKTGEWDWKLQKQEFRRFQEERRADACR